MDYSFSVTYNPDFMERLFISLKKISVYIQPDFHFEPIFSDEEFNSSPLFKLQSFGYEQSRYLENKGKYKQRLFCPTCKRKVDEQIEPLAINTAIVKKYDLVYVDKKIVISDKIVSLFEKWNLTGYRIEQVTHVGAEKFKTDAYQVVPTNILPPQDVPEIFRNDPWAKKLRCPACGTGGHLLFPYHYHQSVIDQMKDFNLPCEYIALSSKKVSRSILLSSNLKQKFIEEKIADQDWDFIPVVVTT